MQLSHTVEYTFRAATYLASRPEGTYATAVEVSAAADIPVHYLSKILRRLVRRKILLSRKGHGGGFRLSRPLEKTRILDLLEAVEYSFEPDRCVWGWKKCDRANPCPLHRSWSKVKKAFVTWARETTLADLDLGADRV